MQMSSKPMSPEELARRKAAANPPKDDSPKAGDAELLNTGQEEVFSRTEVETGRTEHAFVAGRHAPIPEAPILGADARDEAQTERQAPPNASPGEPAAGE
jgi:hypothetical protein